MTATVRGEFILSANGRILLLLREPPAPSNGCVLIVPPFGEEMNKSRRMMTLLAIALAERSVASVIVDLYGTGDSAGDFAAASWPAWHADLEAAARWCNSRGTALTGLVTIRLGAALAVSALAAGAIAPVARTVLWQPVLDGGRFFTQLLRLRLAAMLAEQDRKETVAELKERLARGESLEIAGYNISPQLAADLEGIAVPQSLLVHMGNIHWFEISRESDAVLPTPSARLVDATRTAGVSIEARQFVGEPFWAATEIVENRSIVQATAELFSC